MKQKMPQKFPNYPIVRIVVNQPVEPSDTDRFLGLHIGYMYLTQFGYRLSEITSMTCAASQDPALLENCSTKAVGLSIRYTVWGA